LVCEALAAVLHIPLYDSVGDLASAPYRVVWRGDKEAGTTAPGGGPDGIAHAHGFHISIEATRKPGTKQWSQEFAGCLDHARKLCSETGADPCDVLAVLVPEHVHVDTLTSAHSHNQGSTDLKLVLLEPAHLRAIAETSHLAFTLKHTELRRLLLEIVDCLRQTNDPDGFRQRADRCLKTWQGSVLDLEERVILAIRSYRAMVRYAKRSVHASEILERLNKDTFVRWYARRSESIVDAERIADCLVEESLAAQVGRLFSGERVLEPVPISDFQSRCQRRMSAVEQASSCKP
jgi:hypothetical protein